jgi:hypothetical protein
MRGIVYGSVPMWTGEISTVNSKKRVQAHPAYSTITTVPFLK